MADVIGLPVLLEEKSESNHKFKRVFVVAQPLAKGRWSRLISFN